MTTDELDVLWSRALHESVAAGEPYTRYRFAALVAAAERERIAAHYEAQPHVEFFGLELADAIRARGKP